MLSLLAGSDYEFQNKFRTILATAKALGKKRLILDVRYADLSDRLYFWMIVS